MDIENSAVTQFRAGMGSVVCNTDDLQPECGEGASSEVDMNELDGEAPESRSDVGIDESEDAVTGASGAAADGEDEEEDEEEDGQEDEEESDTDDHRARRQPRRGRSKRAGRSSAAVHGLARELHTKTRSLWSRTASNPHFFAVTKQGAKRRTCTLPKAIVKSALAGASVAAKHQLAYELHRNTGCYVAPEAERSLQKPWRVSVECGCSTQLYMALVAFNQQVGGLAAEIAKEQKRGKTSASSRPVRITAKAVRLASESLHARAAAVVVPFMAPSKILVAD